MKKSANIRNILDCLDCSHCAYFRKNPAVALTWLCLLSSFWVLTFPTGLVKYQSGCVYWQITLVSLIRLSGRVVVAQFSVACGMILNKNFATLKFRFGASTLLGARNECFCSVVFRLFTISFIFLVERDCPVVHLFAFVCFHSRFLALPRGWLRVCEGGHKL